MALIDSKECLTSFVVVLGFAVVVIVVVILVVLLVIVLLVDLEVDSTACEVVGVPSSFDMTEENTTPLST